jgi:arylsulfatase A-like enzyme
VALLLLAASTACGGGAGRPPHVLLVTVDTLRPDYLSFEGYDRPTTSRLDALIARGVYFERAVAASTRPSQSSWPRPSAASAT